MSVRREPVYRDIFREIREIQKRDTLIIPSHIIFIFRGQTRIII